MRRLGHPFGAALGLMVDRWAGEPPLSPHPVAVLGRALGEAERVLYRDSYAAGVLHAATGVGIGAGIGALLPVTAAATYVAVAGRALGDAARSVEAALAVGDIDRGRALIPALVGRDPSSMDQSDLCRAAVESVAENTVDAVVAPALWGAALGAPGALGYRAVNTMDSMVGHHSPRYEHYGWASARLDDVAAWVPARVTAALVAMVRPSAAGVIWRTVRNDAPGHPSPNAGVAEAAFAGALGLRLGGESRYGDRTEVRPFLGSGRPPERADITRAVRLGEQVSLTLAAVLIAVGAIRLRRSRTCRT